MHDDQGGFLVELADNHVHYVDQPSLILAHPGQSIYGHWILDFLPRLHLLSKTKLHEGLNIYLGQLPTWSNIFLEAFGFRAENIRPPLPGLTRFRHALMASSTKSGYRLGQPLMQDAWRHMKDFAEANVSRIDPERLTVLLAAEKIFISREDWGNRRRQIANIVEIQNIAVANGYTILLPERYSPLEQATIFRRARAIIGEDGSALHNIIFAEPACILGVIGVPDRLNLWHFGLCRG